MAIRGNRGKLVVGASGVVTEVTQWSIEESGATIDSTSMNASAADGPIPQTKLAGNTEWSGSLTCNTDPADTDGQEALRAGASMTAKLYPDTDANGKKFWEGTIIITRMGAQGEVGGKLTSSFSFAGTGALTRSTASA